MKRRNPPIAAACAAALILVFPGLGHTQEDHTQQKPAQQESEARGAVEKTDDTKDSDLEEFIESQVITVTGEWPPVSAIQCLPKEQLPEMPLGDGADLIRDVPGVAIGRMGGHGLEPRIRGLGEANLNVMVDGAYVHGGCPNRMDPPSSFAATHSFDQVTVIKGVQSLRYGAGGSGGTVLYERTPPMAGEEAWSVDAATGYGSWHRSPELAADVSWRRGRFYLRGLGEDRSFDNYEDGDGNEVRSAYDTRNLNVIAGFGSEEKGLIELGAEASRTDDALFAGAGMDSPEDANDTLRLKFRREDLSGQWLDLQADLYRADVEHLMDNYSLRELTAPMAMRVPSTSDTTGGRISADRGFGRRTLVTFGMDYQQNQREALRYAGPNPEKVSNLQSVLWPDARVAQGGLFAEGEQGLGASSRLRFGARVDRFSAEAKAADLEPMGKNRSPNQLYQSYYGERAQDWNEIDWSALLRYERRLTEGMTLFTGISRTVRAPDTTERYLAADSPASTQRWIGNPALRAAENYQLDVGVATQLAKTDWSVNGFFDDIPNFILRDRAHGQEGVLQSDQAWIYRNVDARLAGLELSGSYRFAGRFVARGTASYVYGQNVTDDGPLAQIPPLQGLLGIDADIGRWGAGAGLRWAAKQTRVDDDPSTGSGLDFGETPGYAVLDLTGSVRIGKGLSVVAGVDNLFDDTYANHLNRANLFDPDPIRINEPGRTGWLRLRWAGGAGH